MVASGSVSASDSAAGEGDFSKIVRENASVVSSDGGADRDRRWTMLQIAHIGLASLAHDVVAVLKVVGQLLNLQVGKASGFEHGDRGFFAPHGP